MMAYQSIGQSVADRLSVVTYAMFTEDTTVWSVSRDVLFHKKASWKQAREKPKPLVIEVRTLHYYYY